MYGYVEAIGKESPRHATAHRTNSHQAKLGFICVNCIHA
jgi:hypothetical protein